MHGSKRTLREEESYATEEICAVQGPDKLTALRCAGVMISSKRACIFDFAPSRATSYCTRDHKLQTQKSSFRNCETGDCETCRATLWRNPKNERYTASSAISDQRVDLVLLELHVDHRADLMLRHLLPSQSRHLKPVRWLRLDSSA